PAGAPHNTRRSGYAPPTVTKRLTGKYDRAKSTILGLSSIVPRVRQTRLPGRAKFHFSKLPQMNRLPTEPPRIGHSAHSLFSRTKFWPGGGMFTCGQCQPHLNVELIH